jgi:hypothetical protein
LISVVLLEINDICLYFFIVKIYNLRNIKISIGKMEKKRRNIIFYFGNLVVSVKSVYGC